MEYALRVPCDEDTSIPKPECLNPCSNGICSASIRPQGESDNLTVLILVLMEYALRDCILRSFDHEVVVLIRVLMEYALRGNTFALTKTARRLNPCSNGICSASMQYNVVSLTKQVS